MAASDSTTWETIVAGNLVTSDWANRAVRDQNVTVFSTNAARTTNLTSPVNGMLSTTSAASTANGIYHYNGANWRQPWNMPWGVVPATSGGTSGLGYCVVTTAQGSISTATDLTNLSVTFTAVSNRLYRVHAHCNFFSANSGDTANLILVIGGTAVAYAHTAALGTSSNDLRTAELSRPALISGGSTTVKLQAARQTGSGAITMHAGSANVATLVVEDIGPSGAPA